MLSETMRHLVETVIPVAFGLDLNGFHMDEEDFVIQLFKSIG